MKSNINKAVKVVEQLLPLKFLKQPFNQKYKNTSLTNIFKNIQPILSSLASKVCLN